ncbi:hypothetical protein A2U01_0046430, partial [Trifolium medium]|nr:hypothetical protein [Trifolium medium]
MMNQACILKLGRKLQAGCNEFWCNVMWGKYKRNNNINTNGDGRTVNWYQDAWIEKGLRVADLNLNIPHDMQDLKVDQLVDDDGSWKWEVLKERLPISILNKIAAVLPPDEGAGADYCCCFEDAG